MQVGLQLPDFGASDGTSAIAPRLLDIAQAAEAGVFASLCVLDIPPADSAWPLRTTIALVSRA